MCPAAELTALRSRAFSICLEQMQVPIDNEQEHSSMHQHVICDTEVQELRTLRRTEGEPLSFP